MTANTESENTGIHKRFRLAKGTDVNSISDFPYMLQLMASLESIRASLRWLKHVDNSNSVTWKSDIMIVVISGAGWCAEGFRRIKEGVANNIINKSMIQADDKLADIWDRITAPDPDELVRKLHRVRDKYFAHWDEEVLKNFITRQAGESDTQPFYETDKNGAVLNSRYLWPWTAFMYDLVGDPFDEGNSEQAGILIRDIGQLWTQTANLVMGLLCSMLKARKLGFETVEDS